MQVSWPGSQSWPDGWRATRRQRTASSRLRAWPGACSSRSTALQLRGVRPQTADFSICVHHSAITQPSCVLVRRNMFGSKSCHTYRHQTLFGAAHANAARRLFPPSWVLCPAEHCPTGMAKATLCNVDPPKPFSGQCQRRTKHLTPVCAGTCSSCRQLRAAGMRGRRAALPGGWAAGVRALCG